VTDGWFTSSYSGANGQCVEARFLAGGGVAIRHSHDASSAVLRYTRTEWEAFVRGVKEGEFDQVTDDPAPGDDA
jgi:hypothetical protein